jgi:hypothetical protein
MYRLQTVGGFGGKSDQLNAYNVFAAIRISSPAIWNATARRRARPSATPRARTSHSTACLLSMFRAARPRCAAGLGAGRRLLMASIARASRRSARSAVSLSADRRAHARNGLKVRTVEHPAYRSSPS